MPAPPPVPALPDTARLTSYTIAAQTGPFNVNFALYGDGTDFGNWIEVWLNEIKLNPATDFTVTSLTGPLAIIPLPITDAQVTLTASSTGTLIIVGARRPRRLVQFAENHGVAARDFNEFITDIVAELRESWDFLRSRTLWTPAGETVNGLPNATTRANLLLGFDVNGNPIASPGTTGPQGPIGPPGTAIGWINVKSPPYLAIGNGSTDDTAAINSAIAAFNAGTPGGVLYFPAGNYKVTAALTAITNSGIVQGDGAGTNFGRGTAPTIISCTSQTANLFTVNGSHLRVLFKDLQLNNTFAGTPSAGSAISCQSSNQDLTVNYYRIVVHGFYNNIDIQVGNNWKMVDCEISGPVNYGVKIQNTVAVDIGDWLIHGTQFYIDAYNALAAIKFLSSGGGKITDLKIVDTDPRPNATHYQVGIDIDFTGVSSGQLNCANMSIENVSTNHIKCVQFFEINISNCQLGSFFTGANPVDGIFLSGCDGVNLSNVFAAAAFPAAPTGALVNCNNNCTDIFFKNLNNHSNAFPLGPVVGAGGLLGNFGLAAVNPTKAPANTKAFDTTSALSIVNYDITTTEASSPNVPSFQYLAPNLTAGNFLYWFFGRLQGNNDAFGVAFNYMGAANAKNSFVLGAFGQGNAFDCTADGRISARSDGFYAFSSTTDATTGTKDTAISRVAAALVEVNNLTAGGPAQLRLNAVAVASLPAPSATYIGARATVNNSNATLTAGIGAIVAGGGANLVPVFCDGTNWRIG